MNELEDALASAALDGQDIAAREPGARCSPVLPPELIADIIDLAMESLVEQERDLPSQALLTNEFLLSAALVDRTWHLIATSALLKSGLVQPEGVDGFLEQAKKNGMRETNDRVRFGAGPKGLSRVADDSDSPDEGTDDKPFHLLLSSLPNVEKLELVGRGLRFQASLLGPHNIQHLTHLQSFRLECDDPHLWASFHEFATKYFTSLPFSLPALNHFATYLPALHFYATRGEPLAPAERPSLASLEVLPYVNEQQDPLSGEEAESKLLELVQTLPALKYLKVPACWRSDAVEGACEAEGVDLKWT
ncbi:hypothetical protein RQP46_006084 [Phenoliferia psychrophenolica]